MAITGGIGTRAISKNYPVETGLTPETTKTEGRQVNLVAQEESIVSDKEKRTLK